MMPMKKKFPFVSRRTCSQSANIAGRVKFLWLAWMIWFPFFAGHSDCLPPPGPCFASASRWSSAPRRRDSGVMLPATARTASESTSPTSREPPFAVGICPVHAHVNHRRARFYHVRSHEFCHAHRGDQNVRPAAMPGCRASASGRASPSRWRFSPSGRGSPPSVCHDVAPARITASAPSILCRARQQFLHPRPACRAEPLVSPSISLPTFTG